MKKFDFNGFISIFLPMTVIPCLILLVPGQWAMVLCIMSFLCVNPIYSLGLGFYAGKHLRERWYLPLLSPVVFLISTGIFLEGTLLDFTSRPFVIHPDFLVYPLAYWALGITAMGLGWLFRKKPQAN